jgi:hypothetical protein
MATEIGPVDYAIIAFPGNQFRGEIAPALSDLVEAGTIRIIDIAFVTKDADGSTAALELTELDDEVQRALDSLGIEVGGPTTRMTCRRRPRSSSRTRRRRSSSGRTSGRATSPTRCATRAGSSSTSSGSRTRSCRRRATPSSPRPERGDDRR